MEAPATQVKGSKNIWKAVALNFGLLVGIGFLAKWNYDANLQTKFKEFASKKKA